MTSHLTPVMRGLLAVVLVCLAVLLFAVVTHRLTAGILNARRARLAQQTRPLLLRMLADDSPDPAALAALTALPPKQWRLLEQTVVTMLGKVRGASRDSLVELLAQRGTLGRAKDRTRSWSWVRRCEAADMLGAARYRDGLPALVALLSDSHAEVRRVATRALGRVGAKEAVPALSTAVVGPRALSVRDVASALVLLEPVANTSIVAVAAASGEPQVRAMAAEVLGLRGAVEATDLLVSLLEGDPDVEVRIRSARALGRLGVRDAAAPLVGALDSEMPELRAVTARALGEVGEVGAVEALTARLSDAWHRVASNAADSLARLGPDGLAALRKVADSAEAPAAGYAAQALAAHLATRQPLGRTGG